MKIIRFIPLRDHIDTCFCASFDDGPRIRAFIGIDIQYHIAAGFSDHGFDIGDTFFAVALGHQSDILRPRPFRERLATFVPGGMVGI